MKKVLLSILVALCLVVMPSAKADEELPVITDHEKVIVYLFRSSTCSHCRDFLEYFSENYYDYRDYFEIVSYEVSDASNYELMLAVKEQMGESDDGSIPYIVIGNSFDQLGFGTDGSEIIEEALKAYEDESYVDYVSQIANAEGIEPSADTLVEAAADHGFSVVGFSDDEAESGISDAVVVGIIFGVLVLGFGGLVLYSRKK